MTKIRIAGITIGQTPRTDINKDLLKVWDDSIEYLEFGALDNFGPTDLDALRLRFKSGLESGREGNVLVSRLRDGKQITFYEEDILPEVERCVSQAEKAGCKCSILFCTGQFPYVPHKRPLLVPRQLIFSILPHLIQDDKLGILLPEAEQAEEMLKDPVKHFYNLNLKQIAIRTASPYAEFDQVVKAAQTLCEQDGARYIYLDCMGYSQAMKEAISKSCGVAVILPRTIIARIVNEMYHS